MIRISQARPPECQKLRDFETLTWKESVTSVYDIAFYVYFGYCFLAKDGDKMVGLIMAMKTRENKVKIVDWLVNPAYRNRGIGTRLYKRLKKEVSPLPIIAFVNCNNAVSLGRHLKLGFKKIRKIKDPFYLKDGSEWWHMEHKNTPAKSAE